ncbi:hypothetical protein [Marivita geojedonensis]|nr:hypothetical protein [Marivita geojedonensis]
MSAASEGTQTLKTDRAHPVLSGPASGTLRDGELKSVSPMRQLVGRGKLTRLRGDGVHMGPAAAQVNR